MKPKKVKCPMCGGDIDVFEHNDPWGSKSNSDYIQFYCKECELSLFANIKYEDKIRKMLRRRNERDII